MIEKLSEEQVDKIKDALAAGSKIQAIKLYREATGKGLKDSKEFIDALTTKLQEAEPHKYKKLQSQGGGCGSLFILLISLGCSITMYNHFL